MSEALERTWRTSAIATSGEIHVLVRRIADGVHEQPGAIALSPELGVLGDRWCYHPTRTPGSQVSLIERRVAAVLAGGAERWHVPGDNLVVDLDLSVTALPVGARLGAGDVVLEISAKPHAGCAKFRARLGDDALRWVNDHGHRPRRLRGVYAQVLRGGTLHVGDRLARVA